MKNILILANNDTGLYKFRKELLQALVEKYKVYISLPNGELTPELEKLGCIYIETDFDRRGKNPTQEIKLLHTYINLIKKIKPVVVLTYTIKPNIYGGIACRVTGTPYLVNVTGLGTSIENAGILQKISLTLYRLGLKKASCVFFQNSPNCEFFKAHRIVQENCRIIPGSGVNLTDYSLTPYPDADNNLRILFIGRIMKDKGVDELFEAAKIIRNKYSEVVFDVIGFCDDQRYIKELEQLEQNNIVKYHGYQKDVQRFIKESHVTILPSYHEGTANVLLESAAMGRPVIATRVTGCSETYDDGITGLGCEVRNAWDLVEKIEAFINMPYEQKVQMGINGRKKMEKEYDRQIVIDAYMDEIEKI